MSSKRNLHFLQQAQSLMRMPRAHIRSLGTAYDTIASHSHHVSLIAYVIARMEGLSFEEGLVAMAMGVIHDLEEARTGDNDFISKHYSTHDEQKATKDQYSKMKGGTDLERLAKDYSKRKSKTAQCAKDADQIAQMMMEWDLMWQGNKLAGKWFEEDFMNRVPSFYTESAKSLAYQMKDSNPSEWWWTEFVDANGNPKNPTNLIK